MTTAATEQTTDMDTKKDASAPTFAFKTKKHVTLPLLKIVAEKPLYVRFIEPIVKAKPQAGGRTPAADSAAAKKEPPELAHVIDLTTGEHAQIIIGTVLGAELRQTYTNDSYVGKDFEIVQHKVQGKQYATYGITEIEVEEKPVAEEKKPAKK